MEGLEGRWLLTTSVTEFRLPSSSGTYLPDSSRLTRGVDGNFWFAGEFTIDRITPAGVITEFPIPPRVVVADHGNLPRPQALTVAPDGNLWFSMTERGPDDPVTRSYVGKITPAGVVTVFPHALEGTLQAPLLLGPDGNLWFTEDPDALGGFDLDATQPRGVYGIGRVTLSGAISEFALPASKDFPVFPTGLAVGSDGNLWFSETPVTNVSSPAPPPPPGHPAPPPPVVERIGRITPAGTITQFAVPPPGPGGSTFTSGLTRGSDGAFWFTASARDPNGNPAEVFARIARDGTVHEYPAPPAIGQTGPLTLGSDGNLWFEEASKIGRITPAGVLAEFPIQSGSDSAILPGTLARGADGNLWFTVVQHVPSGGTDRYEIGRITPRGVVNEFSLPTPSNPSPAPLGLDGAVHPVPLTIGPDRNLWFGLDRAATFPGTDTQIRIGRITPSGAIREFTIRSLTAPTGFAIGSDGNLWFSAQHEIGRINLAPPPKITGAVRVVRPGHPTRIVLSFSRPLDPSRARNLGNYQLRSPNPLGRFDFRHGVVRLKPPVYDPVRHTVTLTPASLLSPRVPYQLTVGGTGPGGVADVDEVLLDGLGNGHPGRNYVRIL